MAMRGFIDLPEVLVFDLTVSGALLASPVFTRAKGTNARAAANCFLESMLFIFPKEHPGNRACCTVCDLRRGGGVQLEQIGQLTHVCNGQTRDWQPLWGSGYAAAPRWHTLGFRRSQIIEGDTRASSRNLPGTTRCW